MAIQKSSGVTPTERLLADYCDKSFLKLWSYPNPFKDDRKELCDLLAVFENHVFIFFDRENRFGDLDSNAQVRWERWKRQAIDAQIITAKGAERYIRSGRGIFLDKDASVPFPLDVDLSKLVVHKIIVAHGAEEACKNFSEDNVSGSLAICYGSDKEVSLPFMIDLDRDDPVHVLDSHTLPLILGELDTVADLTMYLDEKCRAIAKYKFLLYCGEEDLLADYYLNFDKKRNRHFIGTDDDKVTGVAVSEGAWVEMIKRPEYRDKQQADKVSYLWDEIIQRTAQNALNGTLGGNGDMRRGKSAIHEMAKEPRYFRRALAANMVKSMQNFPDTSAPLVRSVSLMPSTSPDKAYVFLQMKAEGVGDHETEYRPVRRSMLEIACGAARNRDEKLNKVVGIALDAPKFSRADGEDFILLECDKWSDQQRAEYEVANRELQFFNRGTLTREERTVREFPRETIVVKPAKARKIGRNEPCTCGSGKKWKRCHGA